MKHETCCGYMTGALLVVLAFACSGCATGGIEKPEYAVEQKEGDLEVRAYEAQVVAETQVEGTLEEAGNQGFRPLFRYISGANRSKTKIPMTAPVGQEQGGGRNIAMTAPATQQLVAGADRSDEPVGQASTGRWSITFVMPAGSTLDTLPEPADDNVRLRAVPAHRAAAVRYSGTWSKQRYEQNLARLRAWMSERNLSAAGPPLWARYNSPFSLWFIRRNEVIIPIAFIPGKTAELEVP